MTDRVSLESLDRLPLDEARRVRPDVFRLRPDRRFLIALGELELLATGASHARLHLAWTGNAWRIDSAGTVVGDVPEIASYGELRRVLADRARALVSSGGASAAAVAESALDPIRKNCEAFDAGKQIEALQAIDALWPASGLPAPELAALAARAATALSLQSFDTLEIADLLRARALALLALAQAMGEARPADEALLAASFGYRPDAVRIASALPADDPVRLYAEGRTPAVVAAAGSDGADRRTRYLALLSLGERGDHAGWSKLLKAQFEADWMAPPVLKTAAALESFDVNADLGRTAIFAAFDQLGGPPRDSRPAVATIDENGGVVAAVLADVVREIRSRQKVESAGLVKEFEARLGKASAGARGRLWDAHAMRAWHRGAFYSGLHRLGLRYLDQLGAVETTREFAEYLQGSPDVIAAQFAQWYASLSSVLSGAQASDENFDQLQTLTALGGPSVRRLSDELHQSYYKGREASAVLAERVAGRLDARPPNVAFMHRLAAYPLEDFRMVEELCRAWLRQGWNDRDVTTGHCLWFSGDTRGLLAMLDDRNVDVLIRATLLYRYALSPNSDEALCRRKFPELAAESGYAEPVVQGWSYYLWNKKKDYAGAQRAVSMWLSHHDQSAGLIWYVFQGRLARLISLQGRHAEAWRVIQPALPSGQGSVMDWGAEILARLGRLEEAYALARDRVDRYPGSGREVLAEILWRQKRYSEAALALDPPEQSYKVRDGAFRDDLSVRFGDVFARVPDEGVESAVQALAAQGIRARRIAYLFPPLAASGRPELAFRLQGSLSPRHQHIWEVAEWTREGFEYLEKAKGRPAAVAWIQGAVPTPQREAALESFFNSKSWSLLWEAVPESEEPKQSEWIWLLRAGAATVDAAVAKAHREDLNAHYAEARPGDATRTIGRYLMGLDERGTALAAATAFDDRCKAAYFFGLPEIARGRYADASDWFQLVFDSCGKTWSWRLTSFAGARMSEWYTFDQDLDIAAAEKVW